VWGVIVGVTSPLHSLTFEGVLSLNAWFRQSAPGLERVNGKARLLSQTRGFPNGGQRVQ
jgi:hypothetical protein